MIDLSVTPGGGRRLASAASAERNVIVMDVKEYAAAITIAIVGPAACG